jgi:hypothetical protein
MRFRRPAEISDFSGSAVEADGHLAAFEDHRHASLVLGMLQHLGQLGLVLQDIGIFDAETLFLVGFTSRLGVRSAVLAVYNYPVHHGLLPRGITWVLKGLSAPSRRPVLAGLLLTVECAALFSRSPTSGFRSCQSTLIWL